jgi:hypothetical protein
MKFYKNLADEEYFGIIAVAPDCTQLENFRGRVDPARPKGAYYYLGLMFGAYTELPAEGTSLVILTSI